MPRVEIGPDTIIEPFAQILGITKIGADCTVGACSIVQDSVLEDEVQVGAFTMVVTSHLERGAQVGPYARLRMENHVEAGAHVGNFVELKKTRLGAGAKANHLAYLGDSSIGARSNIGAGTIICNYDGTAKHRTRIGTGAFIGSNSTLVAPTRNRRRRVHRRGERNHRSGPPRCAGAGPRAPGRARRLGKEAARTGKVGQVVLWGAAGEGPPCGRAP